ncbi:MAG: c-type cytochrome [Proteobacteria bacterium]|nr:c-type cytochrome [Pseudomonadota bacterium]
MAPLGLFDMPHSNNAVLALVGTAVIVALTATQVCRADSAAPSPSAQANERQKPWVVPDVNKLPDNDWGRTVRYGRDLIAKTSTLIGPEVKDPAHRFAGNNLDCQSCHINAGTKQFGLTLIGAYADYPNYRKRSGSVGTIVNRIQGCMRRSMNGKALPPEGPEMVAMISYLQFLSDGIPVGGKTFGSGTGTMPELNRAADPVRGKTIYANTCAACHGVDGQGQRVGKVGDAKGYLFPPLWGADSYNDGAGMNTLIDAANFIHNNMPQGTTWKNPTLTPEDAWDVAAYIDTQPRPNMANLDRDFPNLLQKPADTPYGPYADDMPERQHKLGPFGPIIDADKKLEKEGAH